VAQVIGGPFVGGGKPEYEQCSDFLTRLSRARGKDPPMTDRPPPLRRIIPRQGRAQALVEAIVEAAAQVLEAQGERGFNTNAVARRAGVSIGALYRYFPDKQAILVALAERERTAVDARIAAGPPPGGPRLARDRAAIRAFLWAFDGRNVARRAAVRALLAASDPADLAAGFEALEVPADAAGRRLSPVQAFVLSRAVHGAMRAAVLEDASFLLSPEFEDELVRLGRGYLGYETAPPAV
jgi:AcrR family transcriptional regulator